MLKPKERYICTTVEATDVHSAKVRAIEILHATAHSATAIQWPDNATKQEAFDVYRQLSGHNLKVDNCPPCNYTVINYFRSIDGLPPIQDVAPERLAQRRLAICRGVLEDGSDACEHLAWPGMNCSVCLCFVDLKARMKKQKCPKGKW